MLEEFWDAAGLGEDVLNHTDEVARQLVEYALHRRKIISTHYQHVDGTSFAAPITASVVAQMLEANPSLTPAAVKNILVSTASRLAGYPALRQGFGVLSARAAVDLAERETHQLSSVDHHPPRVVEDRIVFTYHDDHASRVDLAGDFNEWDPKQTSAE
jgi:serine protease AprX